MATIVERARVRFEIRPHEKYLCAKFIKKIYFNYKYEIYSQKYTLHTSYYPAKYIFPTFSRRKVVYFTYIFFSLRACWALVECDY